MKQALGMIETNGFIAAMEAADAALKAASVQMAGWQKVGSGLVAVFFTGDVASVKTAVDAAAQSAQRLGGVHAVDVIARPHDDLSKMGEFLKNA